MHVLKVRNVHEALPEALRLIQYEGITRDSRNGPVKVLSEPVCTVYRRPEERVLFWPLRDANPFFHFFESLWMLAGRRDVAFLNQFNSNISSYSDDGETFWGAYGWRWRRWFGYDQLECIIQALKDDPTDRRQMLQIWDAAVDLRHQQGMKDLPCNTMIHFQINPADGCLDMSIFNRSNDIVWGCYGANAVHFSFLHEYMANRIGRDIGVYRQISDNWHAYLSTLEPLLPLIDECHDPMHPSPTFHSPYDSGEVSVTPLGAKSSSFDSELNMFLEEGGAAMGYSSAFLRRVATPLLQAYRAYKTIDARPARYEAALLEVHQCQATDWRLACRDWILRRQDNWKRQQQAVDDGPSYGGTE